MNQTSSLVAPPFFQRYIAHVKETDFHLAFAHQTPAAEVFFKSISEEFSQRKYAPGKWTIKEVMQHVIDTERVFSYRAVCFARKEEQILPPFDENQYAMNSGANSRLWENLVDEWVAVRKSTEYLFNSFSDEALAFVGKASDYSVSVGALGFITVGHVDHHIRIIQERYIGV